jgi:prepilin-type N-terminal cleavage/methylation domain-containing protein
MGVSGKARAGESGFTLIELIIVASLFALLVAILVPSVSNITGADHKYACTQLAGTIRFTYDLAARKSTAFRVVIDLDEHAYWVESSSDRFLLSREKTEVDDGMLASEEDEDSDRSRRFVTRSFIEGGDMWEPKKRARFTSFAGQLTKKIRLPKDIYFQDVWVAHQEDRVTSGLAYLYSFPTGMTEQALIHVIEENEDVYSLQVDALTGSVKILPHYVEIPEE